METARCAIGTCSQAPRATIVGLWPGDILVVASISSEMSVVMTGACLVGMSWHGEASTGCATKLDLKSHKHFNLVRTRTPYNSSEHVISGGQQVMLVGMAGPESR